MKIIFFVLFYVDVNNHSSYNKWWMNEEGNAPFL